MMQKDQFSDLQENVQHGNFMMPFAQYVTWLPWSFANFPIHWHKEVEIIYVENGSCEINMGLQQYELKKGDIVIVQPYALHSLKQLKKESGCCFSWVFDLNMLSYGITDACYVKCFKPFIEGQFSYVPVISEGMKGYKQLKEILLELHQVWDEKKEYIELDIKWRLGKLFSCLVEDFFLRRKENLEQKKENTTNVKIVIDYIHEHYQNSITIAELADLLHFSEPYFMRYFKRHTGVTSVDYINDFRMNKAVELLMNTENSIMEIAIQVGMHNISYFNRLFKKKYEMTPKEYRKKYQEEFQKRRE
ncbi:MAG: AraC family transcriptional regulator [Lachnospiraceae bacterium]|nr:AraC family transcriptional regulator [Lachnospiraceae bacterium]